MGAGRVRSEALQITAKLSGRADKQLRAAALKLTKQTITILFNRSIRRLRRIIQLEFTKGLLESETTKALISGVLRGEFGLTESDQKVLQIIEQLTGTTSVSFKQPQLKGATLSSRLTISVGAANYSDILGLPAATQMRTDAKNRVVKGPPLEWLRWLLLEGANRIVIDYDVTTSGGLGRSGLPFQMRKRRGRSWDVPGDHQGTAEDNFITRAITNKLPIIEKRVFEYLRNSVR